MGKVHLEGFMYNSARGSRSFFLSWKAPSWGKTDFSFDIGSKRDF